MKMKWKWNDTKMNRRKNVQKGNENESNWQKNGDEVETALGWNGGEIKMKNWREIKWQCSWNQIKIKSRWNGKTRKWIGN